MLNGEFEECLFFEANVNNDAYKRPILAKKRSKSNFRLKPLRILSKHEIVGLEEIITGRSMRRCSVICKSLKAEAYFIAKDDFLRLIK